MNHARQNRRRRTKARKKMERWQRWRRLLRVTGTRTGRWSSGPNLRCEPSLTLRWDDPRAQWTGHDLALADVDYTVLEMRCLAQALTDIDPTARLLNPIHDEITIVCAPEHKDAIMAALLDPHRLAAMELFGVPYSEVTGAMRETAKRVAFSKNYGLSNLEISEMIHDTLEDQLT